MTLIVMTPMSLAGVTPTSPPPLRGRDREGVSHELCPRTIPLSPTLPPQGGREQASACCKLTALALIAIYLITIPGSALAAGDAAAGRRKAVQCQTCHGLDGLSKIPEAPNLAGQPELYLVKSLNDFRQGVRKNEMMSIVSQSDADVDDLAASYAAIEISVTPKP
jgi:cytochrome c553